MTIFYESVNILITDTSLQLSKGVSYPIQEISKVKIAKFSHKKTFRIGATITSLGICLLCIAKFGSGIWHGNLIYIPFLLSGFVTLSIWFFKRRYVLFIIVDSKLKEVISLPMWKSSGAESLQNISKAILRSISSLPKTELVVE
jgi:hypothetical protein